jgi:hypothetical protein
MLFNKYISPSGERMMWLALIFLMALCVLLLQRAYYRRKNNPLRIKKKVWYSGGLKMSVSIRNIRHTMAEIDAPVIEFRQPRMKKRKFKIVAPGDEHIFPLGLSPQTGYDFHVEFTKLYEREPILRKYRKVIIIIKDKHGKIITRKKVRISLPK